MAVDVLAAEHEGPLLLDSPHSGSQYPLDFAHACPREHLRRFEDSFVNELFSAGPTLGATLIRARFVRTYIDVNRSLEDADPLLTRSPLRTASERAKLGMGLVWRLLDDGTPIYDRLLSHEEIGRRVEQCWRPYRRAVDEPHARVAQEHRFVIHLNCHSMPSMSPLYAADWGYRVPYDFVVGDRDGSTAAPEVIARIVDVLESRGYRVGRNDPFKGADLVRRTAHPALHRHSVQLEINKSLYMDEQHLQPNRGFWATQAALEDVLSALSSWRPWPTFLAQRRRADDDAKAEGHVLTYRRQAAPLRRVVPGCSFA